MLVLMLRNQSTTIVILTFNIYILWLNSQTLYNPSHLAMVVSLQVSPKEAENVHSYIVSGIFTQRYIASQNFRYRSGLD